MAGDIPGEVERADKGLLGAFAAQIAGAGYQLLVETGIEGKFETCRHEEDRSVAFGQHRRDGVEDRHVVVQPVGVAVLQRGGDAEAGRQFLRDGPVDLVLFAKVAIEIAFALDAHVEGEVAVIEARFGLDLDQPARAGGFVARQQRFVDRDLRNVVGKEAAQIDRPLISRALQVEPVELDVDRFRTETTNGDARAFAGVGVAAEGHAGYTAQRFRHGFRREPAEQVRRDHGRVVVGVLLLVQRHLDRAAIAQHHDLVAG